MYSRVGVEADRPGTGSVIVNPVFAVPKKVETEIVTAGGLSGADGAILKFAVSVVSLLESTVPASHDKVTPVQSVDHAICPSTLQRLVPSTLTVWLVPRMPPAGVTEVTVGCPTTEATVRDTLLRSVRSR